MENMINLNTFAGGALAEQIDTELTKVVNNIYDPNTDTKKARKLVVTITMKPNAKRNFANVSIQTKSTLAPIVATETSVIIDKDLDTGKIVAAEIGNQIEGQTEMELPDDEVPAGDNIIDLKKTNSK